VFYTYELYGLLQDYTFTLEGIYGLSVKERRCIDENNQEKEKTKNAYRI